MDYDTDTYDDILGYDADHNDDSQYCEHGTFIGSWWGPDYLCSWCEEGVSVAEMRAYQQAAAERHEQRRVETYDNVIAAVSSSMPYSSAFATHMTRIVLEEGWPRG